jgi:hypothetical protein
MGNNINVKLTSEQRGKLDSFCATKGLQLSSFVRFAILETMKRMSV